jgi:hypothetical protein
VKVHSFTDRKLYKPGETVHGKGIVRVFDWKERKYLSDIKSFSVDLEVCSCFVLDSKRIIDLVPHPLSSSQMI